MKQRIVGFDPSLSNWGIAVGIYDSDKKVIEITDLSVIHTVINSVEKRKSNQDLQRATQLTKGILSVLNWYKPDEIFVEVPHGSQSSRAMASYGICIGILASCRVLDWDFTSLSERQVKMGSIGKKKVNKGEMIDWVSTNYPEAKFPTHLVKGVQQITKAKAEHQADAIATLHVGIKEKYG